MQPYDGWETDELAQITFRFELFAKGSNEELYRKTKDDPGLYFRSKDKRHIGKFRTPSLRYTKYTYPYMHNGMLETLRDVVEFYNAGGGENEFSATKSNLIKPLELNDQEIDDWHAAEIGAAQGADNQERQQQIKANMLNRRPYQFAHYAQLEKQITGGDDLKYRGNRV